MAHRFLENLYTPCLIDCIFYKCHSVKVRNFFKKLRNMICFYSDMLLAPRPTPKLEDHPFSAVRDCLFNIFADIHNIGDRSSIRNLRTRHSVVTGTHFSRLLQTLQHWNVAYVSRVKSRKIKEDLINGRGFPYNYLRVELGVSVHRINIRW